MTFLGGQANVTIVSVDHKHRLLGVEVDFVLGVEIIFHRKVFAVDFKSYIRWSL